MYTGCGQLCVNYGGGFMRVFSRLSINITAVVGIAVTSLAAEPAYAKLVVDTDSVEIHVSVGSSGRTVVQDTVTWRVKEGLMTAMKFENPAIRNPEFIPGSLYVEHASQKTRVPLKLIPLGKQSWEFEANPKMPIGKSYWNFSYEGNLIDQKLIGKTSDDSGKQLYFFHWNPVSWDNRLQYINIYMTLPIVLDPADISGKSGRAGIYNVSDDAFYKFMGYRRSDDMDSGNSNEAIILTTKSINQKYRIDVVGKPCDSNACLTLHFYQENVPKKEKHDLLFYVKANSIAFDPSAVSQMDTSTPSPAHYPYSPDEADAYEPDPIALELTKWLTSLLVGIITVAVFLSILRNMKSKREGTQNALDKLAKYSGILDEIWEAPQLQVGSYNTRNKIAKSLHPIEVGLLLGLSLEQIVGMFVQAIADQGKVVIKSLEPITIIPDSDEHELDDIERRFLTCFDDIGVLDNAKLQEFIEHVITNFKDRTWDCDIDATRQYYLEMMYENPQETDPTKMKFKSIDDKVVSLQKGDEARYYASYHYYWIHCNRYYTNEYHYHHGLSETFARPLNDYVASQACFSGCFTQPNLDNVCHSACHNACHDACHSACHSACHDACHSACHSACVSGGAR